MTLTASVNTVEKTRSEQLFDAYLDFQKDDTIKQKNFLNFQGYIKSKNLGFTQAQLGDVFEDLGNADKKQEVMEKLEPKAAEVSEEAIEAIEAKTDEHRKEMQEATQEAAQEKTKKIENLTNQLNDTPTAPEVKEVKVEAPEEKTLTVTRTKMRESIGKYIDKIKTLKNANESEKEKITKELNDMKEELKKTKKEYENAKDFFMGKMNYKPEELSTISTRRIRLLKKQVKDGVVTYSPIERLQLSTIRRRMTINKLVKKFNGIGDDPVKWVRFVMGFENDRFLRYTGISFMSGMDKLAGKMGMLMTPQQFHEKFSKGKGVINAILAKGDRTPEEQKIIDAVMKRVQYYGYAYARQRASAWTNPFLQAEKNAPKEARIIQMDTTA